MIFDNFNDMLFGNVLIFHTNKQQFNMDIDSVL